MDAIQIFIITKIIQPFQGWPKLFINPWASPTIAIGGYLYLSLSGFFNLIYCLYFYAKI
jgi:hypothetical protein